MLNENKAQRYVVWLKGFLDATGNTLTEEQVDTVKLTLDSIFEHEAKKEVKKTQVSIHEYFEPKGGGIFPSKGDVVLRC